MRCPCGEKAVESILATGYRHYRTGDGWVHSAKECYKPDGQPWRPTVSAWNGDMADDIAAGKRRLEEKKAKPRYSLLPVRALRAVVDVLEFGAKKYSPGGWKRVVNAKQVYYDALLRHIEDWRAGRKYDEESKLLTLGHVACCALILLAFEAGDAEYPE